MGIIKEFKEFAVKGNAIDMAVGIIVGGAFGKIVSSVVNDVIMPPIGKLLGGVDFTNLYVNLGDATVKVKEKVGDLDVETVKQVADMSLAQARGAGVPVLAYGNLIQTVVDFTIIAFCVFLLVKGINSLKKKEEAKPSAPPEPSAEVKLLTQIRDALAKN